MPNTKAFSRTTWMVTCSVVQRLKPSDRLSEAEAGVSPHQGIDQSDAQKRPSPRAKADRLWMKILERVRDRQNRQAGKKKKVQRAHPHSLFPASSFLVLPLNRLRLAIDRAFDLSLYSNKSSKLPNGPLIVRPQARRSSQLPELWVTPLSPDVAQLPQLFSSSSTTSHSLTPRNATHSHGCRRAAAARCGASLQHRR